MPPFSTSIYIGNPYIDFLDNIGDDAEDDMGGLMGGLKSWLGFAGSMTGTGSNVLTDSQSNKPWQRSEKVNCFNWSNDRLLI